MGRNLKGNCIWLDVDGSGIKVSAVKDGKVVLYIHDLTIPKHKWKRSDTTVTSFLFVRFFRLTKEA